MYSEFSAIYPINVELDMTILHLLQQLADSKTSLLNPHKRTNNKCFCFRAKKLKVILLIRKLLRLCLLSTGFLE